MSKAHAVISCTLRTADLPGDLGLDVVALVEHERDGVVFVHATATNHFGDDAEH